MKEALFSEVEEIKEEILKLSKDIHENPEICFEEYKSSGFVKNLLSHHGFIIEDKVAGMETAFKARFKGQAKGPTIAFLAEYDALPGIGHGCGHNIISAVSTGAAIALSKKMNQLSGEIVLLGTPAEEGGGGKIILLENGEFDDVDYALMIHPSNTSMIGRGGLATARVDIEFLGKSAHSSTPEKGINALTAVIQTFNLIDAARALMPNDTNINGIISQGGEATNVIPNIAECNFSVRARTLNDLNSVIKRIEEIVSSVESFTGAQATITVGKAYAERYMNRKIGEVYKRYMESQGVTVDYPDPNAKLGSSDIGNVSLKIPAIHAYVKIVDEEINPHSQDFTDAAITERADEATIKAAKALACTGYELLTDEILRKEVEKEFEENVPKYN